MRSYLLLPLLALLGLLMTARSAWADALPQEPARLLLAESRFVYHPSLYGWNVQAFLEAQAPILAEHTINTDEGPLTLPDALLIQAHYTSLNPQLLLALMEYRTGLLTTPNPSPEQINRAFGYTDPGSLGFDRQLSRAAGELFGAFYFFYYDAPAGYGAAGNAATAALLAVLSGTHDPASWSEADWTSGYRFQETFARYFGDPLPEVTVIAGSERPEWRLPWVPGEQWRYGQGPHRNNPASSDTRLVALDFVPTGSIPADSTPCGADDGIVRDHWIAAAAPGKIVLSVGSLVVVQHNDVWSTGYYHVAQSNRRSALDDQLRIGHPSNGCVGGGYSTTSHVHFTIRENGVMIPIAGQKLSGWIVEDRRLVREDDPARVVPLGGPVPSDPMPPAAPLSYTKPVSIPVAWWYTFHTRSGGDFQARLDERELFTVNGPPGCGNGAKLLFLEPGLYQLRIEYRSDELPAVEMLAWPDPIPCGAALPLPAADDPQPPTGQVKPSPAVSLDGATLIEERMSSPTPELSPGQTLTHTWRLRNSGETTWSQEYRLIFVGGAQLGVPTEVTLPAVAAGQEFSLTIPLHLPAGLPAAAYTAYFRLRNNQGIYFGPMLAARLSVAGAGAGTELHTPQAIISGAAVTPSLRLSPPVSIETHFEDVFVVSWDTEENGTDVYTDAYDVQFIRLPDGQWLDWLVGYPHGSAIFRGRPGHTYCFRSRVHHGSGGEAAYPTQADSCRQVNPAHHSPAPWWDATYPYQRLLLVANLTSTVPVTIGQLIRLYLDDTTSPTANELYEASAAEIKGEDLRIIYRGEVEIPRHVVTFTPSLIDIRFPAQAEVAPEGWSSDYALYYGNSTAGALPPPPPPLMAEEGSQPFSAGGEPLQPDTAAPIVLLGQERGQTAPGTADLALGRLSARPDGDGRVLVQAVVQNLGAGSTQAEYFVSLFNRPTPEIAADLNGSLNHWVSAPLAAGQVITLSTVLTGLQPLTGTEQLVVLSAVVDSTGVISDANRSDNTGPGVQLCLAGQDAFEGDDSPSAALLQLPGVTSIHNFSHAGDQDWLRFEAEAGVTYHLYTQGIGEPVDTWLTLYGADGATPLAENDDYGGIASYLEWAAPKSGVYYVQVRPWNPTLWGCGTGYRMAIMTGDMASTPVLLEPGNETVTQTSSLTLTWQAAPALKKYRLQIAACPSFTATRLDIELDQPSYTATGLRDGIYYWRVQGAAGDGRWGEWSPAWRFTVTPTDASAPHSPVPPPDGSSLFLPLLRRPGC